MCTMCAREKAPGRKRNLGVYLPDCRWAARETRAPWPVYVREIRDIKRAPDRRGHFPGDRQSYPRVGHWRSCTSTLPFFPFFLSVPASSPLGASPPARPTKLKLSTCVLHFLFFLFFINKFFPRLSFRIGTILRSSFFFFFYFWKKTGLVSLNNCCISCFWDSRTDFVFEASKEWHNWCNFHSCNFNFVHLPLYIDYQSQTITQWKLFGGEWWFPVFFSLAG